MNDADDGTGPHHQRCWTVHDGQTFAFFAHRGDSHTGGPEEHRLRAMANRLCSRGEHRVQKNRAEDRDSAAGLLRRFWLLGGKPTTSKPEKLAAPLDDAVSCRPPLGPCRTPVPIPGMPPSVVKGLKRQHLHVLQGWLDLSVSNINSKDASGSTALHFAVLHPFSAAIDLLLARGADENARLPANGATPLLIAIMRRPDDHATVTQLLSAPGIDVDIPDHDGHTALMVASRAGCADTVRVLLEHGASPEARDNAQRNALCYAGKHNAGAKAVAMLLRSAARKKKGAVVGEREGVPRVYV